MRSLAWFIQVGPKCNDKCPYKSEAEGDLTQTEGGNVTREAEPAAIGHKSRNASGHQKLQEAKKNILP